MAQEQQQGDDETKNISSQDEDEQGFIKTATHNYVSRQATIQGANRVELKGKCVLENGVVVRGDLAWIKTGRYCYIHQDTILQPPALDDGASISDKKPQQYAPLVIGSHTSIANNCRIEAAAVGSSVMIGHNVVLGKRCIIKDCCIIEPNSHVANDTVIPPFSRVAGCPAQIIGGYDGELPEAVAVELVDLSIENYQAFVQKQQEQ